jgi:hypothetical protein
VRRAPPIGSGTDPRRTPFCASSLKRGVRPAATPFPDHQRHESRMPIIHPRGSVNAYIHYPANTFALRRLSDIPVSIAKFRRSATRKANLPARNRSESTCFTARRCKPPAATPLPRW